MFNGTEFKAGGCGMASSPAVGGDGAIYLGSWDRSLYALSPEDGTVLWRFRPGGWMSTVDSSPVIGEDGILLICCMNGKMYALRSGSRGMADSPWPMYRQNQRRTGSQR